MLFEPIKNADNQETGSFCVNYMGGLRHTGPDLCQA
jgi:hypothetical protein